MPRRSRLSTISGCRLPRCVSPTRRGSWWRSSPQAGTGNKAPLFSFDTFGRCAIFTDFFRRSGCTWQGVWGQCVLLFFYFTVEGVPILQQLFVLLAHFLVKGLLAEHLEEIEGGILNALFVGDQTIADTFEQDNLIDIGLGVAPMQMFFAAVNLGGYGYASRRAKNKLREADAHGQRLFGEEGWQQMKQTIDETKDVNELKSVLRNVVNGGQYSTQAKQAAFRYAAAREGYKGAVLGEAAAQELRYYPDAKCVRVCNCVA